MNTPYRRKMATQITLYIAILLIVSIAIITGLLLKASFDLVEDESLDKVYYLTTSITNEFNMSLQNVTDIGESLEGMIRKTYSHVELNNNREAYLDDLIDSYIPHVRLLAQDFSIANTAYLYFNPELDGKPHDVYFVDDNQDGVVGRQEQLPVTYFSEEPSEVVRRNGGLVQLNREVAIGHNHTIGNLMTVPRFILFHIHVLYI